MQRPLLSHRIEFAAAMQWRFEKRYGVDWQEFELPDSVANIKAAALFIHDRDDKETRFEGGKALARTWPDARLYATEGLGHRRILRNAAVVQSAIDFITDSVRFSLPPESETGHAYDEPARLY